MSHQGRLMDSSGVPLDGAYDLEFGIWGAPSSGTEVWNEVQTSVSFDNGYYNVDLGAVTPMNPGDFDGSDLWLSIAVDGGADLGNRVQLHTVPYAFHAANIAPGAAIDASSISVDGTTVIDSTGMIDSSAIAGGSTIGVMASLACTDDQVAVYASGAWGCQADNAHEHAGESITSGLIPIAAIPVGPSAGLVAAGNHTHTGGPTATECPAGQVLTGFNSADFTAICKSVTPPSDRVFTRVSMAPQFNYRNNSDNDYNDLDLDFTLRDDAKLFIASTGTLRMSSGTCHNIERVLLNGQTLYRPYPVVSHTRSHWAPRLAFTGSAVEGGQHSIRLQVGDNHNDGTCGYQGDSAEYGRSRMAAVAMPAATPMAVSHSGSLSLNSSWQDVYGAGITVDVAEDSDLVMLSHTTWHGNNHHTAGEAQARFRFSLDGSELGNDTTGEQSVSTYTEEWWRPTAMFGVQAVTPGSHTVNLRSKVTTGAGSVVGNTHMSLVGFALPTGQVFYAESPDGPVSDTTGADWIEIASLDFTMTGSASRQALVMGQAVQSHPLSTTCHGAHRLEIDGVRLGANSHGQGIIMQPQNGLEWSPFLDMSGVKTLQEGVAHNVKLLVRNSGGSGTCTWNGFGGGQARLMVIAPTD